ncbi:hypothetical protein [Mesorhizobium australicum]|uniref:hypothetical protein n=1 Tax=Mesorhizobium australicum TaxID=536018 RepID=UPI0033395ACE
MEKRESGADKNRVLNDNAGLANGFKVEDLHLFDKTVVSVARLIGRQIAREHFETLRVTKDNVRVPDILEDGN